MAGAAHSIKPALTNGASVRRLILAALVVLLFLQNWKSLILPLIDVGVSLVGMAAKNAILVVEFTRDKRKEGMGLTEATLEASRTRLRPIILFGSQLVDQWRGSSRPSVSSSGRP
jgi:multidrug efflux pump subunit AcrB